MKITVTHYHLVPPFLELLKGNHSIWLQHDLVVQYVILFW